MGVVLLVVVGVLGLLIGSFLNVVIARVPAGESVVRPASRCPSCASPIRPRHNVPVAGWLVLRGRCADCAAPISPRYPVVELLTGVLFVLVAWRLTQLDERAAVPAFLVLTAAGVALSAIDMDVQRLPNRIVLPLYPVLVVLLAVAALVHGDGWAVLRSVVAAAASFAAFAALAIVNPAGMGFGDVKLAGVLGLALGYLSWSAAVVGAFAGFLLGAVVGIALLAGGRSRKSAIPFGPFMVAGALLALWVAAPASQLVLPT